MEPYICQMEHDYTTQVLLSAARLRDTNAGALYQLIRKKIGSGKPTYFDLTVEEFKYELDLYFHDENGDIVYNYPEFKHLNSKVIKQSLITIQNITEITSLTMDIIERTGRKASKLRFSYIIDSEAKFRGV
jgi:hypothetical protein